MLHNETFDYYADFGATQVGGETTTTQRSFELPNGFDQIETKLKKSNEMVGSDDVIEVNTINLTANIRNEVYKVIIITQKGTKTINTTL